MTPSSAPGPLGRVAAALHHVENGFYVMVAVALAFAGAALFVNAIYQFGVGLGQQSLKADILDVLDGLLLVFIVSELLHTVRTVIDAKTLRPEPFLIVGIVAVIRRLIVISAEAADFVGDPRFTDLMIEMGVLVGAAVGLGLTVFLLRLARSEPVAPG